MSDNVNIIVQDTINDIVVNTAVVVETIDINVQVAVDDVNIIANPNNYVININRIIGEQVQSDWNQNDDQEPDYIKNKPSIPTLTSDLTNDGENGVNPFITANDVTPQVNSDWNATSGVAEILNKPTIPAAQVNSDWNATSGVAEILNKPTIPSIAGLATVLYVDQQDALKVDKVAGKGLSENDFTNTLKTKLDGIETGAQVNVNADWNAISGDAEILNKPTIPTITNLVPYTGATQDVNLNGNDLYLDKLWIYDEVNDNFGSVHFTDGNFHIEDADNHKLIVIEDGFIQLHKTDLIQSNLYTENLTQTRDHYLPNQSGTIALTSDITGINSGTNTGDETTATIKTKLGITTLSGSNTGDQDLTGLVVKNTAITGATKTKITFDSKGLVTSGADATTADIADSVNKRYQTDNQQSYNDATSSIQTQINSKANDNSVVHLAGTETIMGQKTFNPNVTAASLIAKGTIFTPTLVASANSDVLVGLDIAPTFSTGAFTSVIKNGIRLNTDYLITDYAIRLGSTTGNYGTISSTGAIQLQAQNTTVFYASTVFTTINGRNLTSSLNFALGITSFGVFMPTTGNFILQNGGIFTDIASSRLTVNSTTQGFLPPRMTTVQKNAIVTPATGLVVYDSNLLNQSQYNGTSWVTPYKYINTTPFTVSGAVHGLTETIMAAATINPNTFSLNDIIKILYKVSKIATVSVVALRIRLSNSPISTASSQTIATYSMPFGNVYTLMQRNFTLTGGNLIGLGFTSPNAVTDITSTITADSSTTYDPAIITYILFTAQLNNILDSVNFTMANITN